MFPESMTESMAALFPGPEVLARAFYEEAVRHLTDSYCLHHGGSAAGAIASAMKAGELGAKSVLILQNALGIYDRVFNTHKPYTELENHPILGRLTHDLDNFRANLSLEVREMEGLEPKPFGKRNFEAGEANPEYPFLLKAISSSGTLTAEVRRPHTYFTQADSLRYCRIAHELLTSLPALEARIASWQVALPARL